MCRGVSQGGRINQQSVAPIESSPEKGLTVTYTGGDKCDHEVESGLEHLKYSTRLSVQCDPNQQFPRITFLNFDQTSCQWVIELASKAGCQLPTQAKECSAACHASWIGDGVCDPACNTDACGRDKGDCTKGHHTVDGAYGQQCAPGCELSMVGDGHCDRACDVASCRHDGVDCFNARANATICAWTCPRSWLADGTCDQGCNTAQCEYDGGDCKRGLSYFGGGGGGLVPRGMAANRKCHVITQDLRQFYDLSLLGHSFSFLQLPQAGVFSGVGVQYQVSVCRDVEARQCRGRASPAIALPDGGECVGLGDLDTQAVALMPKQRGLVITYTGGDYCVGGAAADRPRHRVTYYVYCNQAVQPVKLLQMDTSRPCETRLWFQSAAGCAIATAKCAATCPKHWLGDGTCDQGCNNEACGHDGGDCWGATADAAQCSPGCKEGWLGDGICDEECRSHACQDDRGDCAGQCAPGCEKAWLGDGKCDEECNTPSCNFDGADCFDFSTYTSHATTRCAWGCPANWRANGKCDPGCDVAACGWDGDDCLEGSITKILKGSRRTAGPLGPTILFALVALTLYLTYQWRDDLMNKDYKSV